MATVSTQIKATHSQGLNPVDNGTKSYTQATSSGPLSTSPTQSIGTSEEVINFGDLAVADLGAVILRNLDATNYIDWGPESGGVMVACGRILPGEEYIIRVKPSVVLRAQANTAACLLQITAYAK